MAQLSWHGIAGEKHRSEVEVMITRLYRQINTAYASEMMRKLKGGAVLRSYPSQPNPCDYQSAKRFARDYLAYNIIRKNRFWDVGIDKGAAAMQSFERCEARLKTLNINLLDESLKKGCLNVITRAAQKISSVLGPFNLDDVVDELAITSGASTRLPRRRGAPGFKLSGTPHCTPDIQHLVNLFLYTDEVYMREKLSVGPVYPRSLSQPVLGARLDLVPKNYKTDRLIAIEPEMNMMFQRGVGKVIRNRLRGVGIDLKTQSYNQYLALVGSRTGSLVTIDLEAASDSVSRKLVEVLLPPDWFSFLDLIRSKRVTKLDGSTYKLEKFSSMGNGFTFELETLVFWALVDSCREEQGCADRRVAVYGDDIICHNSYADRVIEVLSCVGFNTNEEKTFLSGPFRESCGKHYFYGVDVTPFNFTKVIGDVTDLVLLHNSFNEWCLRLGLPPLPVKGPLRDVPIVPRSLGLRAGVISDFNPYRTDNNGLFELKYFAQVAKPRSVPQFGQYWMTLKDIQEEPLSRVVESMSVFRMRKMKNISVWE